MATDFIFKMDIHKSEKIQRKVIGIFESMRHLDNERVLDLPSLQYKCYRGDMIAIYNMLHRKYDIGYSDYYPYQRSHVLI